MTRAQRKQNTADLIKGYVDEFRQRLKVDVGYDIRARIDRERDPLKRGAMLAAERIVYKELRGQGC